MQKLSFITIDLHSYLPSVTENALLLHVHGY